MKTSTWQPIDSAPKDGTRILATGRYPFGFTIPIVSAILYDTTSNTWEVDLSMPPSDLPEHIEPTLWIPCPELK